MNSFGGNMSQFYPLKAAFEQILGHKAYLNIKETSSLAAWVKESEKLLRAVQVARRASVHIADPEWHAEFDEELAHGRALIKSSKTISELFAYLAATLAKLVFLQLGSVPRRPTADVVPLQLRHWQLDGYRTVQYVQTEAQRACLERRKEKQ